MPWRRPGFQLGLDIAAIKAATTRRRSAASSAATASPPGARRPRSARRTRWRSSGPPSTFIAEHGRPDPFGAGVAGYEPLPEAERRDAAAALAAVVRGLASTDRPQVGHFTDSDVVLDFLARAEHPRLAALGTSCPDHFLRTKVRPLVLDLPPTRAARRGVARLRELHARVPRGLRRLLRPPRRRRTARPMRGADPAIVLVPGVGMFSFGKDKQTARVAGEFYVNAINVMRGAEALSTYAPIDEREKFRIEYWALEEAKLARMPEAQAARDAGRVRHRRAAPASARPSRTGSPPRARASWSPTSTRERRRRSPPEIGGAGRRASRVRVRRHRRGQVVAGVRATPRSPSAASTWSSTTPACRSPSRCWRPRDGDWDLQHDVMAKGSFLVSREAARVMLEQGMGGDIVYISSKNAVFAGPNNVAYGAAKADQAHQVRLLAAELGEHGIRVNGVNPDGVVRGSGIFAGGWGAERAAVYGVPEEELGAFYAQRTLLKREVLPEHVAAAVFALTGGDLTPHHRAAHPGRRRRRRRVPALTRRPPSSRRSTSARPAAGSSRPRRPGDAALRRSTGSRTSRCAADGAALGRPAPVPRGPRRACAGRRGGAGLAGIGVDSWAVDYGLLDASGRHCFPRAALTRDRRAGAPPTPTAIRVGGRPVRRSRSVRRTGTLSLGFNDAVVDAPRVHPRSRRGPAPPAPPGASRPGPP